MKPTLTQIPLAAARGLAAADYLVQRKSDGRHCIVTAPAFEPLQFNAEAVSHSGPPGKNAPRCYRVNDVLLSGLTTRERWRELQAMAPHFPPDWQIEKAATINHQPSINPFLEEELSNGGEGVVLKPWHTPFGIGWLKAKRSENFIVRVTDFNGGTRSVFVADAATGAARGKVALLGDRCERVRVGSVLKLTGYGLTARGQIREPRPDADEPESWLMVY